MTEGPQITDWITAGSAIVAAGSAVWYTFVTRGLLKAQQRQVAIQKEQLDQSMRLLADARRPLVRMSLGGISSATCSVIIRNYGDKPVMSLSLHAAPPGERETLIGSHPILHVDEQQNFGVKYTHFGGPLSESSRYRFLLRYSNYLSETYQDEIVLRFDPALRTWVADSARM